MATEYTPLDISNAAELLKLAEEVQRTKQPRVLRRADEDLAVITPVTKKAIRSPIKQKSQEDIQAFLSSAGAWKDVVDTGKLKADIAVSRRLPVKPRPEL